MVALHALRGSVGNGRLPRGGMTSLARALRAERITMREFAAMLGVHRSSLNNWQTGKSRPSPEQRLEAVWSLRQLGIDPGLLFPDHGRDPLDNITNLDAERQARGISTTTTQDKENVVQILPREPLEDQELAHWGLDLDPFEDDPANPENIWRSPQLERFERVLFNAITRRQIVALEGEPGSGKSTLLRRFIGVYGPQRRVRLIAPASLDRQRITASALAVAILRDLTGKETSSMAQEPRSELLRKTLADQDKAGNKPVLLIDEAHLLSSRALIAIKQIWDSHVLFRQLAVVMVGQRRLGERLRHDPDVREVTGRTRILTIQPMADASDYLRWRFARVGDDADRVFDPDAYKALAVAGEYPLWISVRAEYAMRHAMNTGSPKVSALNVGRS